VNLESQLPRTAWQKAPKQKASTDGFRVAIVDDDSNALKVTAVVVQQAKFIPVPLNRSFESVAELVRTLLAEADAAIVDHRLTFSQLNPFTGAEVVADLFNKSWPAVLTTQYYDQEADVSIREYRASVPVVLPYDDVDAPTVIEAFRLVKEELAGQVPLSRKPRRVQLRIVRERSESQVKLLDVIIPAWNPRHVVSFPLSLVGSTISQVHEGDWLEAGVNIGAENAEDLFFVDFAPSPEPDPNDGLG
jgi:hypothetical protein